MRKYSVKAFGITKEILGKKDNVVEADIQTVAELRSYLQERYPELKTLRSLFIAVNSNYAEDTTPLTEADEIALIPPVSGG